MCFSAQASFAIATALSLVGGITFQKSSAKLRPIACIPFIFALQQALEGIVWVTLNNGDVTSLWHQGAVNGFIAIAGIFWPLWVPGTLYALESNLMRKQALLVTVWGGGLVSLLFLLGYIFVGREVHVINNHLSYSYPLSTFGNISGSFLNSVDNAAMILYMIVTVSAPLLSSFKYVWILGVMIGLGWLIAAVFYYMVFGSVWCYFAAIASLVIYYIVRVNSSAKV